MTNLDGFAWLITLSIALAILQRRLHYETQAILLLITRRNDITLILFSLLLFPGVLLHETSHYLMARLLFVRTGRFSLLPRPLPDGRLQLGFVETASADPLRDALIGSAPLLMGGAFVVYAGLVPLGLLLVLDGLTSGNLAAAWNALVTLHSRPDFWLWFYLTFAVSSTMLPSASDRRAWLPLAFLVFLPIGLVLLLGLGPWLAGNWNVLAPRLNGIFRALALIFGISALVHLVLLPLAWVLRKSLGILMRVLVT